jgi:aspartyl-tRNA(Asn)/glutamyl-tRNA(Gln) amidotransferase subunit C
VKIDRDTIRHLERLARIELEADEVARITEQLDRIVTFVEQLQAVDTTGVEPAGLMAHEAGAPPREDAVREGLPRETVLGQAPDASAGFFRVPRVIGKGES